MNMFDETIAGALDRHVPLRENELGSWERVLERALAVSSSAPPIRTKRKRPLRVVAALVAVSAVLAIPLIAIGATQGWFSKSGGTVPDQVVFSVHGRAIGWTKTGSQWFVVYLQGGGKGICGLEGATWRMALVATSPLPSHIVDDRSIAGAMCGNQLSWVRAGRFSDGKHQEVAFMLWTTPSIGATTYLDRIEGKRLVPLARFGGDKVVLGPGSVTVSFENAGRSPHGELEDLYRFQNGHYRLTSTKLTGGH